MQLTKEEFEKIRSFEWTHRSFNSKIYNTLINETQTRLFWLDFYRLIFAPKYAKQTAITSINDVDLSRPVLLDDNLDLIVSPEIESVAYFVDNQMSPPVKFTTGINQMSVLIVALILLVLIATITIISSGRVKFVDYQVI
jgi:hypothetical protein